MTYLNEDTLVQQTTADYLRDKLGWESIYAYNQETFGADGLLGRNSLPAIQTGCVFFEDYLSQI